MRAGVGTVVLACCAVTAGCAGFGSPSGDATSATVTPAPVPDTQPERVAPGLTESGVQDVDALVRAHAEALSTVSFTVEHRRRVVGPEGTLRRQQYTRAEIAAGYQGYTATREVRGLNVTDRRVRAVWAEGRAVEERASDNETQRRVVADSRGIGGPPRPPRDALFFEPTFHERLHGRFTGVAVTAVEPAREVVAQRYGAPVLRVRADGVSAPAALTGGVAGSVSDLSFTAAVDRGGLVRAVAVQYTVRHNETTRRHSESLRYSDIGTTTVERR